MMDFAPYSVEGIITHPHRHDEGSALFEVTSLQKSVGLGHPPEAPGASVLVPRLPSAFLLPV